MVKVKIEVERGHLIFSLYEGEISIECGQCEEVLYKQYSTWEGARQFLQLASEAHAHGVKKLTVRYSAGENKLYIMESIGPKPARKSKPLSKKKPAFSLVNP